MDQQGAAVAALRREFILKRELEHHEELRSALEASDVRQLELDAALIDLRATCGAAHGL